MDGETFEKLLYRGESEILDFKVEQYPFEKATDDEKSELLKDVMAFANAWRDSEAHILIGVEEVIGGPSVVRGITKHLSDHELQQFVNSKTQKPIAFRYESISIGGKKVGVISIPLQVRPFFAKSKFGKVEAERVYLRRGSSTGTATPDEIAEMGKKMREISVAIFEIETSLSIKPHMTLREIWLDASLLNKGNATAYDVQVTFESEHRGNCNINYMLWKEKPASHSTRAQSSLHPIHQGDKQHIFSWPLGVIKLDIPQQITVGYGQMVELQKPVKYLGDDVKIQFRIFARDLSPTAITISYTKEEIQSLPAKTFQPVE